MFLKHYIYVLAWTIIILLLTILPGNYFPHVPNFMDLFSPDKIVHLLIFGTLCLLSIIAFGKQYSYSFLRYNNIWFGLIYSISMGAITELLQGWMNWGRQASIYDFIANLIGCFIGIALYHKFYKKKLKKQTH